MFSKQPNLRYDYAFLYEAGLQSSDYSLKACLSAQHENKAVRSSANLSTGLVSLKYSSVFKR